MTPNFHGIDITRDVLKEVLLERQAQEHKWGQQNHEIPFYNCILVEEVGEVSKAILEKTNIREELVQVAAVAVAMIETLDRRSKDEKRSTDQT